MSIYNSSFISDGDYFDQLRSNVQRDYGKGIKRADEDYGFSKERLDSGLADVKEDVSTGKKRAGEDYKFTGESLNRQLAQVAQSTFRRFVKNAPNIPTQFGLQNLATRGARLDKERNDFLNLRQFDRSIFDFDKIETRAIRNHDLDSRLNVTNRDRRKEDTTDGRDDQLLGINRSAISIWENTKNQQTANSFAYSNPMNNIQNSFNSGQNGLQYSTFNPTQVSSKAFGDLFNRFF